MFTEKHVGNKVSFDFTSELPTTLLNPKINNLYIFTNVRGSSR